MKHLTIRNVPDDLHEALQAEKTRRGVSLNQAVIDLLSHRLGLTDRPSNGLADLAGRWTDEEFARFEDAVASFEVVDNELWT